MIEHSQPPGTSIAFGGDNTKGPDIYYSTGETETHVQVKAVTNASQFDRQVRKELRNRNPSQVIAVQVPAETPTDQLMGKLRNNFPGHNVYGRSILVVDPGGKGVIPKQPFPQPVKKP